MNNEQGISILDLRKYILVTKVFFGNVRIEYQFLIYEDKMKFAFGFIQYSMLNFCLLMSQKHFS